MIDLVKDILKPSEYIEDIFELDFSSLKAKGIKLILLDINNTLLPGGSETPSLRVIHWFEQIQQAGFKTALLSNGPASKRNSALARLLDSRLYCLVGKPLAFGLKSIIENDCGLLPEQTALIGDQVFGDILPGNWLNVYTILVKNCDQPLTTRTEAGFLRKARGLILDKVINKTAN